MSAVNEYEDRILCEIEELKYNNIFSLINSILTFVGKKTGEEIPPKNDPGETRLGCEALRKLFDLGYVKVVMQGPERGKYVDLADDGARELLASLEDWFVYDEQRRCWTCAKGGLREVGWPGVEITDAGVEAAYRVLDERGYRWWDHRNSG